MSSNLFRAVTAREADEFRKWARANYKPLDDIKGIWHPVVQTECALINREHHQGTQDDFATV